jgi:hypothetical protein
MTEPLHDTLSVHLDEQVMHRTVAGLRSFGESILAGLLVGRAVPTRRDFFLDAIRDGGMVGSGGPSSGDIEKNWKQYTKARTEPEWILNREAPRETERFDRKITAEIRQQQWQGLSLAFPWALWDSIGHLAWGVPEFRLKYAQAIQSIIKERYFLREEESRQIPLLSPNTFWLLLSLTPIGGEWPGKESPNGFFVRLREYLTQLILRQPQEKPMDTYEYQALAEIGTVAQFKAQRPNWADFWDQWLLGEIHGRRLMPLQHGGRRLERYVKCFPIIMCDATVTAPESVEASISIPVKDLRQNVPAWHDYYI